jgi:hypothetical protein
MKNNLIVTGNPYTLGIGAFVGDIQPLVNSQSQTQEYINII